MNPCGGEPGIELRTLGSLDLRDEQGRELRSLVVQPKRVALFAYLALGGSGEYHRRDSLTALFWPESDEERARASLRQALRGLRRGLGDGVIVSRGDHEVAVSRETLCCDVWGFDEACARGEHERAVELYRGPFLEGFSVDGLMEFQQWLDREQSRLARSYSASLRQLAAEAADRGDDAMAVERWRRVTEDQPYHAPSAVAFMSALERMGDRPAAILHAERYAELIRAELQSEPDPSVIALADRLRSTESVDRSGTPPPMAISSELVVSAPASRAGAGPSRAPSRFRRVAMMAAGVAIVVGGAVGASLWIDGGSNLVPNRVVVARFENRTGDPAHDMLGQMVAEWVAQGLAHTGVVEVIPVSKAALAMQALDATSEIRRQTIVARLAQDWHAGLVVTGSYYLTDTELRFHAELTDAERDRAVGTLQPVMGSANDPMDAAAGLRDQVMGTVATYLNPRYEKGVVDRFLAYVPSWEAYREYAAGHERRANLEPQKALDHFYRAIELDSTFTEAIVGAALAHFNLGQLAQVDSLGQIASRARDRLSLNGRLMLDIVLADIRGDRLQMYRLARAALKREPTSGSILDVAVGAMSLHRLREAVSYFERIDVESPDMKGWDGAYWEGFAHTVHLLGDHERELTIARRARTAYPNLLRSVSTEANALAALGRVREVNELLDVALSLPQQEEWGVWGPWVTGQVMTAAGMELRRHGNRQAGDSVLARAVQWYRERESELDRPVASAYVHTLLQAAEYAEAERVVDSLRIGILGDEPFSYIGAQGILAAYRGDRQEARRLADQLIAPVPGGFHAGRSFTRAVIHSVIGEEDRAVELLADAFKFGWHGFTMYAHNAPAFDAIRDYRSFLELMRPKG